MSTLVRVLQTLFTLLCVCAHREVFCWSIGYPGLPSVTGSRGTHVILQSRRFLFAARHVTVVELDVALGGT